MKFKLRSKTSDEIVDELATGGKKKHAPKKGKFLKQVKLSKKPQFVLSLGDEGTILTCLKDGKTDGRWYAPEASPENLEVFGKAIASYPGAPMTIVFDTMDQHYSQQTLPPVSKMSVGGLLKRRASREFGRNIELQGNYLIDRSDSKEWNYMLYAMEANESVQAWIDWLYTQPIKPKGIRVLPLEVGALINVIAEKDAVEQPHLYEQKRGWQYLLTYNKVSGVRQVIMRDGKMMFTRLGQPLDGDAQTEAGAIEQEVISTVEYLKRIGLKTIHDLHLYIVAGHDVLDVLDSARMGVGAHTLMSPHKLIDMIGLDGVVQPEDRFGDVAMAAFIAAYGKSKHVLWTKPMSKIRLLYLAIPTVRAVGALVVLGAIGAGGIAVSDYFKYGETIQTNEQKKASLREQVEDLKLQSSLPPEELEKILELYEIYVPIKQSLISPRDFFINTSWMMSQQPKHMRVQHVSWESGPPLEKGGVPAQPQIDMGIMGMEGQQAAPPPPTEENKPKKDPPPNSTANSVIGRLNVNILVPSDIKDAELQKKTGEFMDKLRPYYPYYTFALQPVQGARKASDAMSLDLDSLKQEESGLKRVTLKMSFSGIQYVPNVNEEGEQ